MIGCSANARALDLLSGDAKGSPWLRILRWNEPVGAGSVGDPFMTPCAFLTCFANASLLV